MLPLYEYEGKRVKIITVDGKEWHGYGDIYVDPIDNENGEESMAFKMDGFDKGLIELYPSEIKSIEIEEE